MTRKGLKLLSMLAAPTLSLALLGAISAEHRKYLSPADFEPYHIRAKAAIEGLPKYAGSWYSEDASSKVPKEAQALLKPNKILMRHYSDISVSHLNQDRRVNLLIVQCKLSGDMVGHFPPICYPSHGYELESRTARDWPVAGITIPGMEYHFIKTEQGHTERTIVYNFFIVPTEGLARDIDGVKAAAEDYQERYYGAAQFQVEFAGDLSPDERDQTFTTLMESAVPVIEQLNKGEIR